MNALAGQAGEGRGAPRRVLVVAYHFPPQAGSSGIQRTLRFVQYLPRFGWQPVVLTIAPGAYESVHADSLNDVPPGVVVIRAFGFDAARTLGWRGRYPAWLARPDRWTSWWPDAVRRGRAALRSWRPAALFSTFPIATAHRIAYSLAGSGLPWIADFRDPMAQDDYPADVRTRQAFHRIEARVAARAAACTFTTPGAARDFRARHPDARGTVEVIENGFDESAFAAVARPAERQRLHPGAITLLHSGLVYPSERDPTSLFAALARLKAAGLGRDRLRVRFRGAMFDGLAELARTAGVEDMVEIAPLASYRDALQEMLAADGLLVMQASNCNRQVPAKLYEYMRAARPMLALTDPCGDTAAVLADAGVSRTARLDDAAEIESLLAGFVRGDVGGLVASRAVVDGASRERRTEQLAALLDRLAEPAGSAVRAELATGTRG